MYVQGIQCINFGRKPSDMKDYSDTLRKAKMKVGNGGKSMLILPVASLPDKTGMGNLGSAESLKFFDFAKQYWGINEIQLLPVGRYHEYKGKYPIYSGTSMDLGAQMIDIKSFVTDEEYKKIIDSNKTPDKVNYRNILHPASTREKILKNLYKNMPTDLKQNFEKYKSESSILLEKKGLYQALIELNGTHNYKNWNNIDSNLFDERIVNASERDKRIAQIHKQKGEVIDFYKFKQFLAEISLQKAKEQLNSKGLKLNGDLLCGFSYDEVWSNPKAFLKDVSIGWGLPALNLENPEAEKILREKTKFYAKHFDGFRVDAAWTYIRQPKSSKDYGEKFLNIIEDEVKKVKGNSYDLKNITYEFVASADDFNIHDGESVKPYLKDRVKLYTSDWLSNDWGSNKSFLERGWDKKSFILGATNHDSKSVKVDKKQAEILSKILKIPAKRLNNIKEFIKAKLAEPTAAYNNMLFIREALNLKGEYNDFKIPDNYEKQYLKTLEKGEGFNPMDALEKTFVAQGLDKTEPELYKKIVKYRKILESKGSKSYLKYGAIVGGGAILLFGLYKIYSNRKTQASA